MILIKDATIVDGTGGKTTRGDVLIKGEKIAGIGKYNPRDKYELVLDARGKMLTPGFIDFHATSDHYLSLFSNPSQKSFLLQGVTSILGGHCGASLAPL